MRKLFSIIGSLLAVLCSCKEPAPDERLNEYGPDQNTNASVIYESDGTIPDETDNGPTARIAAGERAKLTVGYMNNETEIFRPSGYVTRLWWFSSEPALSSWQDNSAVKNRYNTPTVSIVKPTNRRSYTRKTIKAGWYIGEANESGIYYKFNVSQNSDGLLITNENSTTNPAYSGYYSGFGKLKVSLWYGKGKPADAHITLSRNGQRVEFWLYAEDGTGTKKGMYWFVPAGNYQFSAWANKPDGSGQYPAVAGNLTVASGKVYPHIKLAFQ